MAHLRVLGSQCGFYCRNIPVGEAFASLRRSRMSNDNRDQGERSGHSHREEDHDDQPLLMRTSPRKDFDGDLPVARNKVADELPAVRGLKS